MIFSTLCFVCAVGAWILARGVPSTLAVWWLLLMVPATIAADALSALWRFLDRHDGGTV